MDTDKLDAQLQFIEKNGVCLNVDEKIRLDVAFRELKSDLHLSKLYFVGKVSGKLKFFVTLSNHVFAPLSYNNLISWYRNSERLFLSHVR